MIDCPSCQYAGYLPDTDSGGATPILWKQATFNSVDRGSEKVYDATTVEDGAGGPDVAAKYLVWVKLNHKATGRDIYVINLHIIPTIDGGGHPNNKDGRVALYTKHMNALLSMVDRFKDTGLPVFVMGDFNIDYVADAREKDPVFPYVRMGNHGMWANWRSLGVIGDGTHENRHIDYIYSSRHPKFVPVSHNILPKHGSDHSPVITKFNILP